MIPSLADFADGDRDEMLFCPIRAIKRYLKRMEQFRLKCSDLFVSIPKRKKWVSQNTVLD